jgi:hypothetical protein
MTTVKLRIRSDGSVTGLWSDAVDWQAIGRVDVRRASHVEFCGRRQMWYVRAGRPSSAFRCMLQLVLRRPCGRILYWASSRAEALAWEAVYFGPDGRGWRLKAMRCARQRERG